MHSNAYGKVLFAITLLGGAVLALLVGRRLYHRFRGQPDPADLDRPRRYPTGGGTNPPRHRRAGRPNRRSPHPTRRAHRPAGATELTDAAVVSPVVGHGAGHP